MARLLPILLVLGLLGGTAAAFAITEGLKLEKSPIGSTHVDKLFSPVCNCKKDVAEVSVQAAEREHDDGDGDHAGRRAGGHDCEPLLPPWDDPSGSPGTGATRQGLSCRTGCTSSGSTCATRRSRCRTRSRSTRHRRRSRSSAWLPASSRPTTTGAREYVTISFSVSATARPLLYVGRRQVGRGRLARSAGSIHWYGGVHGETYPPGVYQLSLARRRSRREHLAADERRPRRDPVLDARAEGRPRARRQALRASGRERRQERPVASARQVRAGAAGDAAAPRSEEAGSVQALRHLQRPLAGRARGRLEVTAELARAGGPIGCAGLALLLLATRRDLRLAGLGLLTLGALFLLAYLAPTGHRPLLAAAGVLGLVAAAGGAWLFLRWPWLVPLAALACVPARIPVKLGTESANLLIPLYAVVVAAGLALAWRLVRGDERSARARAARLAAGRVRRLERPVARLERGPAPGRDHAPVLLPARSACSRSCSRACPGAGAGSRACTGCSG